MKARTAAHGSILGAAFLVAMMAGSGCDSSSRVGPPVFEVSSDDPADALGLAIQDEYRAEATYTKVLAEFGDARPFNHIALAEGRHVRALAGLFATRGLEVPSSEWDPEEIPSFATLILACEGGVRAETENVAMYDALLAGNLPDDVRTVFTNLQAASRDHHLPAFTRCAEGEALPEEPPTEVPEGEPPAEEPPPEAPLAPPAEPSGESEVYDALGLAIQDEYRTEATYGKVLADFGDVRPFDNIALAEGKHIGALAGLFAARGLEVPSSEWSPDQIPSFATLLLACEGGVGAEMENVAMYDTLLAGDLPADVRMVFTNLRAASWDHHLPAFTRCVDGKP